MMAEHLRFKAIIGLIVAPIFACATETSPHWASVGAPVKATEIPEADYAYLAHWLAKNSKPAQQYLIDLFEQHQIVVFGEAHNVKEHKDFIIELIPRLYHEAGVRCIGWEFSRHTDNLQLEKLVTSHEFDKEASLEFARDQLAHEWNSKEHWDFIKAVWHLNNSLKTGQERMRLIGLDMDVDFTRFFVVSKTKGERSPEFKGILSEILLRDRTMAEQVEIEVTAKNKKGLLFVGRCHDFTHYEFPPDINSGREIMGHLLHQKLGDRVFQVWPSSGMFPIMEKVMEINEHQVIGFDLYTSPFKTILTPDGWYDAPGEPMARVARGYVYLGPTASLHTNTPIKGFVTEEMFTQYKRYYEIDFGRTFRTAEEVDDYLQAHRFPNP